MNGYTNRDNHGILWRPKRARQLSQVKLSRGALLALNNIFDVLLGEPFGFTGGANPTGGSVTTLGSRQTILWTSQSLHRRDNPTWRHWNLQVFRGGRNDFFREIGNMNSLCFVLVALRDDLNYNKLAA